MKLSIPDMTCAHCKATVERTIIDLDSAADVAVDLGAKTATVTTTAPGEALVNALASEGYPATILS
jgi:copper chaperone